MYTAAGEFLRAVTVLVGAFQPVRTLLMIPFVITSHL